MCHHRSLPSLATFAPHPVCHHCSLFPSLLLPPCVSSLLSPSLTTFATLCAITALSFPHYFCHPVCHHCTLFPSLLLPPCVSSLLSLFLTTFAPHPVCHHCSLVPSLLLLPTLSLCQTRWEPPTHLVASNYASGPVRIDLTSCGSSSSLIPPLATVVPSVTRY